MGTPSDSGPTVTWEWESLIKLQQTILLLKKVPKDRKVWSYLVEVLWLMG